LTQEDFYHIDFGHGPNDRFILFKDLIKKLTGLNIFEQP